MVFDVYNFVEAIWVIMPAFAANGLAPLARGRYPIDFNRTFGGKPILGKGKTWEGLFLGTIVGMFIASLMGALYYFLPFGISAVPLYIVPMNMAIGLFLGFGAVFGDAIGSFVKRRIGIKRGRPAPILDQIDFMLGGLLLLSFIYPVKISWVILLVIITPIFHLIANTMAYFIGIKGEPY